MREYHIDTHPIFLDSTKFEKKLSIRSQATRPLMMIGQDKSVFEQYSFGRKCWVGPGGETQLLPKSNGYSKMVSGFVSSDIGVGLYLSKNELEEVKARRMGSEWGHYLSRDEALTVYGTSKRKEID